MQWYEFVHPQQYLNLMHISKPSCLFTICSHGQSLYIYISWYLILLQRLYCVFFIVLFIDDVCNSS